MKEPKTYDAIVIGGGHNGLTAAAYLAKAGLRVRVAERRSVLGGAAATEAVFPGYKVNTGAADAGLFRPEIVKDLRLEDHGLQFLESPAVVCALQRGEGGLILWRNTGRSQVEIAKYSEADARKFPKYVRLVERLAGVLESMVHLTPPGLPDLSLDELLPWLKPAWKLKRLGDRDMMDFMRLLPMPVSDFLDEWFQTPLLKAALGYPGVIGNMQGPLASGTTFLLLYHAINAGKGGFRASRAVRGGTGALSEALAAAARGFGAEVCAGLGARQITLEDGKATGVAFDNGEWAPARAVLSSADARRTFFDLIGAHYLPVNFVREVKNIKFHGSTARVNLALTELPRFSGIESSDRSDRLSGRILICPDLEYLERAYDDAKFGQISRHPVLEATIPSLMDGSLAPPGQHLMSVDVRYAPYRLESGSWDNHREELGNRVVATLETCAPGFSETVLYRHVLTPLDLEREYGLTEGSIYHGQMGLDQLLFMRPVAGFGQYRTPVENVYLCGAGAHPGGGVTGAPGYNAAREVIKQLK